MSKEAAEAVFQEVYSQFEYVRDIDQYNRKDQWQVPVDGKGDCEDFALWCRKLLNERGVIGTLIVLCWTETGGYHAVLSTAEGYILDNRMRRVTTNSYLEDLGYKWDQAIDEEGKQFEVGT